MRAALLSAIFIISCSGPVSQELKTVSIHQQEASAVEKVAGSGLYWVVEDSGNRSAVYGIDANGKTKAELKINAGNNDWESLAADNKGNLYIGDFGNNSNTRKDLKIYRINKEDVKDGTARVAAVTYFNYPEQNGFPPKKSNHIFDCEAFIEYKGNFYLFTKNRSSGSDGSFSVYKVPNSAGNYEAHLIGTLSTCAKSACQVTGADISPNGSKIILLTADAVYLLTNFNEENFNNAETEIYALPHNSQKEGICFEDDDTLIIVDEKNKSGGGNMYTVDIRKLKRQN